MREIICNLWFKSVKEPVPEFPMMPDQEECVECSVELALDG
jgi:hypothetical protein